VTSPNDPVPEKDAADPAVKPPSLVPGVVLLVLAGALIVITLIKPDLPHWLTITIAVAAIVVVILLLIYAFRVFRDVTRPGGSR
jgi:membrane protein implicated in regulation of membrane protease activity